MSRLVSADRGVGEFVVVDALPEFVVVVFAAVSHLADPWFLFGLLALGYWFASDRFAAAPRRAGATAIAVVTCGYAAVALGKAWFAVPRPPGALPPVGVPTWLPGLLVAWYETQVLSDGFGFPSGHATGAAGAYVALALLYDRVWTPRKRLAGAAAIAVAVAASRVVIEVHFLVDVVAGLLLGVAVVVGSLRLAGDPRFRGEETARTDPVDRSAGLDPRPVFLLAAVISAVATGIAAANGHGDTVIDAGIGIATGLGGAVGWLLVDGDEPSVPVRIAGPALLGAGGLWVGAYVLSSSLTIVLVATFTAVAVVIGLPALPCVLEKNVRSSSVRP